jgi:hypothetical protein
MNWAWKNCGNSKGSGNARARPVVRILHRQAGEWLPAIRTPNPHLQQRATRKVDCLAGNADAVRGLGRRGRVATIAGAIFVDFEKESQLKFKQTCSLAFAVLLALPQLAAAQGPSGGNGAVASIPSSVYRAADQGRPVTQPGILSLIGNPMPPAPVANSRRTYREKDPAPSK